MTRTLVVMICAAALAACTFVAPSARAPDEAAVRADVTALVQRWSDAGEAGDWEAVADTYADADGFVWIEQGEVRYADHAAIIAGLEQAQQANFRITNDVSEIVVTPLSDDAAAYRANYHLVINADAFSIDSRGVLSGVAIRQGQTWRLLQGAFSEQPQPSR